MPPPLVRNPDWPTSARDGPPRKVVPVSCRRLPFRHVDHAPVQPRGKENRLVCARAVAYVVQHEPEITVLGGQWRRRARIGSHVSWEFPTAEVGLHVELPAFQPPFEHLVELPGIVIGSLAGCH